MTAINLEAVTRLAFILALIAGYIGAWRYIGRKWWW